MDTGSGFNAIPSEVFSNYAVRDANQNDGGVVLSTLYEFEAGDILKLVVRAVKDGSGTPALTPNQTRITLMKVG